MIDIKDVSKKYGNQLILDHINMHINPGEIFGLLGPNGAGKSTLLLILATILKPTSGSIMMNNRNIVVQPNVMRKWLGFVPQDIALYPMLTVLDNLKFWSQLAPAKVSNDKLLEIARVMHLSNVLNQKVQTLSGGMKRKLNIAVAILHDPKILILDEPTVGIDIESKRQIVSLIKSMGNKGTTIIYTTHDVQEVKVLCQRTAYLNKGAVEFIGTVEEAERKGFLNAWTDLRESIPHGH